MLWVKFQFWGKCSFPQTKPEPRRTKFQLCNKSARYCWMLVWPRAAHQLNELFINHLKVQTSAGPGWCKGWQRWMAPRLSRRRKTQGGVQTYPSSPYPAKVFWKSLSRGVRGGNRWQSLAPQFFSNKCQTRGGQR